MSSVFHRRQQHWGPLALFQMAAQQGIDLANAEAADSRAFSEQMRQRAAEQDDYDIKQSRIAGNTRAVNEGAFGPMFGATAGALDSRASNAEGIGSRNVVRLTVSRNSWKFLWKPRDTRPACHVT